MHLKRYGLLPAPVVLILSLSCAAGQHPQAPTKTPVPSHEDPTIRRFFEMRALVREIEQERRDKESEIGKIPPRIFDVLFPLAKLRLDQAMLFIHDIDTYPTPALKRVLTDLARSSSTPMRANKGAARRLLDQIPVIIKLMKQGRDPFREKTGNTLERAYIARNDNSAQPYYIYVSKKYAAEKKWPLFVFLHGWVPETSKTNPWIMRQPEVLALADKMGFLFLQPHGRRNTDFLYVGEQDILDAVRETKRFYTVDEDRIYLIGASMGGAGVWHLGIHYPDKFAAIGPINGQIDWFRFWSDMFDYPPREKLPKYQQWMMAVNNPMDLLGSLVSRPTYLQHALLDRINNSNYSKEAADKLKAMGAPVKFFLDPDPLGHYIYFESPVYRRAFETLSEYRHNRTPGLVQHHTYSLRFPKAYWVTIDRFQKWGPLAKVRAEKNGHDVVVTTTNIIALTLELPPQLFPEGEDCKITWNGRAVFKGKVPPGGRIKLGDHSKSEGLLKTNLLCGPVPDAFNSPFLLVRGTTGTEKETENLRRRALHFVTDWWAYAEGVPPVKTDAAITPEDINKFNLVLFGRPGTNRLLGKMADKLPIRIAQNRFTVGSRTYKGRNLGLCMIYPNPLNPQKYVVVFSGYPWGEKRASNHKFDLLPDFIIYDNTFDRAVETNHARCSGFFDVNWNLSKDLLWTD